MKKNLLIIAAIFATIVGVAYGAGIVEKFQTDSVQFGLGSSGDDKTLTVDVGDGASNPNITIDATDKDFTFSKAVNVAGNIFSLGDGANTNKVIEFDIGNGVTNPKFRWNSSSNSMEFSNDGTNYSLVGSGSGGGGGVNLLANLNPDFEQGDPPSFWTASGGTFAAEGTAPLFGDQSASWDSNGSGQQLDSTAVSPTPGMLSGVCQAEARYSYPSGSNGDYEMIIEQVDDSEATTSEFAVLPLNVTTNGSVPAQLVFDCPDDTADELTLRFESTVADADEIFIDSTFLGFGKNFFNIQNSELVAHAFYPATASCEWIRTGTTPYVNMPTDSDCPAISVITSTLNVDTTDDNEPTLVITDAPKGRYYVEATFPSRYSIAGNSFGFIVREKNSSTDGPECGRSQDSDSANDIQSLTCGISLDHNGGDLEFTIAGAGAGGGDSKVTNLADGLELVYRAWRVPRTTREAITLETSGFVLDAFVDSSTSVSLGNSTVGAYTFVDASDLSMTKKTGSVNVEIPCESAASTGLTCSGSDELLGVSFDAPTGGTYHICADFNHLAQTQNSSGDSFYTAFRLVETNSDGSSVLQTPSSIVPSAFSNGGTTASINSGVPISVCGFFNFSSAGKKTIRVEYAQDVSGVNLSQIRIDGSIGDRRARFYGFKINEQFPTPAFTDLQNSLDNKVDAPESGTKIYSAYIEAQAGTPNVVREKGSWIDSITDNGVGSYDINITAGTFDEYPNCLVTSQDVNRCVRGSVPDSSTIDVDATVCSTATSSDMDFYVICMGQ